MSNDSFSTRDTILAAYLLAKEITLLEIRPIDKFHSLFIFEQPPEELVDYYVHDGGFERQLIHSYRHLTRDAKRAQRELVGGER